MISFLAIFGLLFLAVGIVTARRVRRRSHFIGKSFQLLVSGGLLLAASGMLVTAGYLYWYTHRPLPDSIVETLYEGVTYSRDVRSEPRPLVIHVIEVDMNAPGIGFLVTPGQPSAGAQLEAKTTSDFLDDYDLQVAVNGDFFRLWPPGNGSDSANVDEGDPLRIDGFASSQGMVYSVNSRRPTLFISQDNEASFVMPEDGIYNAISGDVLFLYEGSIERAASSRSYRRAPNPRTAIALDTTGDSLLIVVIDGRQPNYSEGVSLAELAQIIVEYGGNTAINLDGGGSATLVTESTSGKPLRLNTPISSLFPGSERPVANHLGVYALSAAQVSEAAPLPN